MGGQIGGGTALGQRRLASRHAGSAMEVPRQAMCDATAVSKLPQRLPRVVLGPALSTAPRRWPLPPKPDVLPRPGTLAALRRLAALAVRRGIAARAISRQGVHRSAKRARRVEPSSLKAHFRPLELRARSHRRAGRSGTFSGSGARQERGAGRSGGRRSRRISTVGVRKRAMAASRHFLEAIVDARKSRFGRNSGQGPPHHTPVAGGVGSVPRVPPGWVVWWAGPWPES